MPAKSRRQLRYIFYLRKKYGSKEKTPGKFQWVWKDEWTHLQKGAPESIGEESDQLPKVPNLFKTYLQKVYDERETQPEEQPETKPEDEPGTSS